ncbi:DUF885 domain-containing protein [uncultured Kordia sp.]|uniref:DUF885 domain-containing protein n=1 Tax=uncultured Kordia sp. TaxID=507699 RepID=UPI002635D9F0|nr:DUF885 domain-containing protein [uncultured Kordia sp.]
MKDFKRLHIADLQIYYVDNLELIQSNRNIAKQEKMFLRYKIALKSIDFEKLTKSQQLDYALVSYEIDLHLERIVLEKKWLSIKPKKISTEGLQQVPMGKEWYAYFLKKWVDAEVTPDELFQFGLSEIERVKKAMNAIEKASGLDSLEYQNYINRPVFFFNDVATIQKSFEIFKEEISPNLVGHFPKVDQLPDVYIEQGKNKAYGQVPAYYAEVRSTFYYNYFDTPFNRRQVAWIFMHEAIPGHHYQIKYEDQLEKSKIKELFSYSGYREGWAAYVEELIHEFGTYTTKYDELGKWEWDIIRSVRVAMDVGLNYYDWSDEKALEFWQQHIQGQDDIAKREIGRMTRWPAQVITYKYGVNQILQWKAQLTATLPRGKEFPWLAFHTKILQNGALPYSVMDAVIFGN